MSFEIQELPDIIKVIILLNLTKGSKLEKNHLKSHVDKVCAGYMCVDTSDLDKALTEMASEGLIQTHESTVQLTEQEIGRAHV